MFNRGGRQARPPFYPSDPMNPRILSLLAACILTIGPAASQAEERPVRLHTLDEMNTAAAPLNSHAGAERYSVLESVRAYRQLLPAAKLKTDRTAIYPRIKRMADGRYILFVQGGQIASRIYYCTSDDLLHWSDTRILFEPYAVTTSEGSDTRCFSTVDAVVLADGEPKTPDAIQMLSLVRAMQLPVFSFEDEPEAVSAAMDEVDVIVDAIYGSGFHGEIDIRRRQITQMINEAIAAVFSLDIPSGINCDTGEAAQDAVNADFTIAFDSYKPAHLLPKYLPGLGQVSLAPIGIDSLSYEGVAQNHFVAGEDYVYSRIPQRQPDAHKTSTGKLLNIAGGIGCTGAAVLSSTAAMRSGAGYVVTGVPQAIYPIIAPSLVQSPFCFIETAADVAGALTGASAIAIGCGMGTGQRQRGILEEVLYLAKCPVVIDADGINNLAMDISIVADAKCPVILTPHFGEMAKICRTPVSEIQKAPLLCAQELAAQLKATIVLKGAHTIISSPDGSTFINQTGNPGLAKAGSGDVLTGILASLISQGMPPFEAAVCAVYLHGAAADRCIERMSEYFMQPDDILIDLGRLLKEHIR